MDPAVIATALIAGFVGGAAAPFVLFFILHWIDKPSVDLIDPARAYRREFYRKLYKKIRSTPA